MPDLAPAASQTAAQPAQGSSNLVIRVVAALILAPLTVALAFAGGWMWTLLATAAAIGMYLEWHTIVNAKRDQLTFGIGVIALEVIGLSLWFGWSGVALSAAVLGTTLVAYLSRSQPRWNTTGFIYAAAALAASVLVRLDGAMGFYALIFTLLIVWGTDVGGYFAGRIIGGPKLWPRISPKKTWAGAVGGLLLSLAVAVAAAWIGWGRLVPLLVLATFLSVVSQWGDLFESAFKRKFGVKDSSQIIPGHGGLLDRLDGFVAAIVFAAIIGFMRGGLDGVGRGFMIW